MKNIFEIIGIDDYEFTARYIPAFILELLVALTFSKRSIISLESFEKLNNIFPLWIYVPIAIIIISFPIKASLRVVGEAIESILWHVCHPTVFYLCKFRSRESKNIKIKLDLISSEQTTITLYDAINREDFRNITIEKLKAETRNDKKLREKTKEYGLFRNTCIAFLIAALIDLYFTGAYYRYYTYFAIGTGILALIISYYIYPKQLLNSFIEKQLKDANSLNEEQ